MGAFAFLSDYWPAITATITFLSGFAGLLFQDRPNSKKISFVIFVLFGAISMLGTFNSIHESKVAAEAESDKRFAMKDLLHNSIEVANSLNAKPRTQSQADVDAYEYDFELWSAKTGKLIEDAYGKGERDVFESFAGLMLMSAIGKDGPMPTVLITSKINAHVQRLNALMERIETMSMRPDFDPRSYHPKGE
jgi:hypothetical protein